MNLLKKIAPEWPVRIGLGIMFLYSGYDIVIHPTSWYWAIRTLPLVIQKTVDAIGIDTYLRIQGVGELIIGLVLLAWFLPRRIIAWVAFIAAVEMAFILVFGGVDAITFRDIGLLGGAATLFIIMYAKSK